MVPSINKIISSISEMKLVKNCIFSQFLMNQSCSTIVFLPISCEYALQSRK